MLDQRGRFWTYRSDAAVQALLESSGVILRSGIRRSYTLAALRALHVCHKSTAVTAALNATRCLRH